jgi:S1-C subfamily serine protease
LGAGFDDRIYGEKLASFQFLEEVVLMSTSQNKYKICIPTFGHTFRRNVILLCFILSLLTFTANCSQLASFFPTTTPTTSPTPEPTATPTPLTPLSPSQIFNQVSTAVVFIETPTHFGSGILISEGYIVTNAHVVWPFDEIRVVFSDGHEYTDVPIVNWDLMGDLAVAGHIETGVDPLELVDGEDLVIGSDVFLIGYPGEVDEFPEPAITRGLVSRIRQWDPLDITFFQTDATIAGGQSGGVLVSEMGKAIGISGFSFSEAEFGLVASSADVLPRIQGLIANEDVDELGDRALPLDGSGQTLHKILVRHEWDSYTFILNQPIGSEIEIEIKGGRESAYVLSDIYGHAETYADDRTTETKRGTLEVNLEAPYILSVFQNGHVPTHFWVKSNYNLAEYEDVDDGKRVTVGETIVANIDHHRDIDFFEVHLEAGEVINVIVDSVLIDPFIIIGQLGDPDDQLVFDDDTAGGMLGLSAELTFEAPHDGAFLIIVRDSSGYNIGGYLVKVDVPYEGAPTPIAPEPTPTPIKSEFGRMALYESQTYPFTMEYPADWIPGLGEAGPFASVCRFVTMCIVGQEGILTIIEEDLNGLGFGAYTLEEYVDLLLSRFESVSSEIEILSREERLTAQGQPVEVITTQMAEGAFTTVRFVTLYEGVAFNASYISMDDSFYEELQPMIEYSFNSFKITEIE